MTQGILFMENKFLRACAVVLIAAIIGGSTLPYAFAEGEDTTNEGVVGKSTIEKLNSAAEEADTEDIDTEVADTDFDEDLSTIQSAKDVMCVNDDISASEVTDGDVSTYDIAQEESPVQDNNEDDTTPLDNDLPVNANESQEAPTEVQYETDSTEDTLVMSNSDNSSVKIEDVCTYTVSGDVLTITGYKGSDGVLTVPKQYSIGGTSYTVLVNLTNSANTVNTLEFEAGYDLTNSLSVAKVSDNGFTYYTNFRHCVNVDLSNVKFTGGISFDGMFYNCTELKSVKFPSSLTITSLRKTFEGDTALADVNVDSFIMNNCVNADRAFYGCSNLTTLDVAEWNISSLISLQETFAGCTRLSGIDLSTWSSDNVITIKNLFSNSPNITNISFNGINISASNSILGDTVKSATYTNCTVDKVAYALQGKSLATLQFKDCIIDSTEMTIDTTSSLESVTFDGCKFSNLRGLNSSFKTKSLKSFSMNKCEFPKCNSLAYMFSGDTGLQNVTFTDNVFPKVMSTNSMFESCSVLENVKFTGTQMPAITDAGFMFRGCTTMKVLDLSCLGATSVQRLSGVCTGCKALKSVTFGENATLQELTTLLDAFANCEALEGTDFGKATFEKLLTLEDTFVNCKSLNSVDFGSDATFSELQNLYKTFSGCNALTYVNFGNATMNKVEKAAGCFENCYSLQKLDTSKFIFGNCTEFTYMFGQCYLLENLDVSSWDVSAGVKFGSMFYTCSRLKNLDVSKWRFSQSDSVKLNMKDMFSWCCSLQNLDVSSWNTQRVTNMDSMFEGCTTLHSIDVSKWDISNVTKVGTLFGFTNIGCLNLASWKFNANVNLSDMFAYADIKTLLVPDCSELTKLNLELINTDSGDAVDEEYINAIKDALEHGTGSDTERGILESVLFTAQSVLDAQNKAIAIKNQTYHNVLDKSEVQTLTKEVPSGTVLSRICVTLYADKNKAEVLAVDYPVYGASLVYSNDKYNVWYDCDTDAAVTLSSITDSINAYGKYVELNSGDDTNKGDGEDSSNSGGDHDAINESNNGSNTTNGSGNMKDNGADGGDVNRSSDAGNNSNNKEQTAGATSNNTEPASGGGLTGDESAVATGSSASEESKGGTNKSVQTGDNDNIVLNVVVLMLGMSVVSAGVYKRRRS